MVDVEGLIELRMNAHQQFQASKLVDAAKLSEEIRLRTSPASSKRSLALGTADSNNKIRA